MNAGFDPSPENVNDLKAIDNEDGKVCWIVLSHFTINLFSNFEA